MALIVRLLLVMGGALAALVVARDAPGFPVVQALFGLVAFTAALALAAVIRRR